MESDERLKHVGVKGMKWGVHKKYYKSYMDSDRVLKKGFNIYNVSSGKKRDIRENTPMYGSHTENDRNAYGGQYAKNINWYGQKAYGNQFLLTKDVKIPSQKKTVDVFMELYKKDPVGMSNSIGKAYSELDYFHRVAKIRDYNAKRISKKLQKKGEEWVRNKGYLMFNQSMMAPKESEARTKYYDLLMKKGYKAISDVNDVQNYGSDDPIIFINPKKTLKNVKSKELTLDEIEIANARYEYSEATKEKGIIDTLFYGEYRRTKKQLKEVEKKQLKQAEKH